MGIGSSSAQGSGEYEMLCRRFSESELSQLKKLFQSLAAQSKSNGEFVIASVFQAYFGLHGALGARLFDLVTKNRNDQRMTLQDLVIAKATYEKGFGDDGEQFMYKLLDLTGDELVDRAEVEGVVISILETVLGPQEAAGSGLPDSIIQAFLKPVSWSDEDGKLLMSFQAFRQWCKAVPSVKKFLATILQIPPSSDIRGRKVPQLQVPPRFAVDNVVLRREQAWHIAGRLQPHESEEWILLYHSSANGFSFNTFLKNVSVSRGCTILVVRDKEGCVFGGYASQPWEKQSDFYGDMKSFLFTLHPEAAIYKASGRNTNTQWCAINYTSDSIPNGFGFGGQINHFGLFINSGFDGGSTFSSVTFGSPALSSQARFVPDVIECWGIVVKGSEGNEKGVSAVLPGTVLERFKEERNMLNLVGIANSSNN